MSFVEKHLPCPNCESSDAFCRNEDGSGWCFSCETHEPPEGGYQKESSSITKEKERMLAPLIVGGTPVAWEQRKISKRTCEFFGVKAKNHETYGSQLIFPYADKEGSIVAQKVRSKAYPKGNWLGEPKDMMLFGADKFSSGRTITIVEGEPDVLAFRELEGDFPVVSIINGAGSATKDVMNNFEYFNNFDEIKICFDNDKQGRKAAREVADLFPIGKVKIVNLTHAKDACEYLQQGLHKEFKKCWWQAESYTPAGIVLGTDLFDRIVTKLEQRKAACEITYPFEELNKYTYGIRRGEMITIVAGSGVGKSAFTAEMMYKILTSTPHTKIGVMMMEEAVEMANLRLMSIHADKPFHLPDTEYEIEELKYAYNETVGLTDDDGLPRVVAFDHFGSNSVDTIMKTVDHMAALGCKYLFLDHISIIVSDQSHGDERKALDEIATKLRTKVQEKDICLFLVSHLRRPGGKPHEEGGETSLADIRGTAGIGQLSDIVLGLERNQQDPDPELRNVTKVRVLKNRFSGLTGLTSHVLYDVETGRLVELTEEAYNDMVSNAGFTHEDEDTPVFDNTDTGTKLKERESEMFDDDNES